MKELYKNALEFFNLHNCEAEDFQDLIDSPTWYGVYGMAVNSEYHVAIVLHFIEKNSFQLLEVADRVGIDLEGTVPYMSMRDNVTKMEHFCLHPRWERVVFETVKLAAQEAMENLDESN